MKNPADYVLLAKRSLGDAEMSDRVLGLKLADFDKDGKTYSSSAVSNARYGNMSDALAMAIAAAIGDVDPGEVVWVARMEREKDEAVKSVLQAYVGKVMAVMPSKAGARSAFGGVVAAVAISAAAPSPSQAQTITAPAANAQSLCIM